MRPRMFSHRRRFGAALVAFVGVLALVVALEPAAFATGASRAAGARGCSTSKLVVWLDTQGNGAAGSVIYNLEFTNLSGHSCTLRGFPGVSAVSLTGHQLGSAASRSHARKSKLIRLTRGGQATALLKITQAGNFPPSSCHQVTAAGLRVFPPNQTASKTIPFPFSACSRSGPVYLTVRAVQKG